MHADGGSLPVQALPQLPREAAAALHATCSRTGSAPFRRAGRGRGGREVFVLTARTTDADVDAALRGARARAAAGAAAARPPGAGRRMTTATLAQIVAGRGRFAADLAEFVRFASVGADPRRRGDVVGVRALARRPAARARACTTPALARTRGPPDRARLLARRGRRADGARLRSLRRPAGRAAARLAHAALRARARRRRPLRPRRLRRQGPGAVPRRGDREPPRDERPPAGERRSASSRARRSTGARICPAFLRRTGGARARRRDRLGHPHARRRAGRRSSRARAARSRSRSSCRRPGAELHAGQFGGAVANPLEALCAMLAQLHDARGRIAVPGLYDRVRPIAAASARASHAWRRATRSCSPTPAAAAAGEAGFSAFERTTLRPALVVTAVDGGYGGPGAQTAIPPGRARG